MQNTYIGESLEAMLFVNAKGLTCFAEGKPAGKVTREHLLLEAKRLLRYSGLPIAEIAYHLKFDAPSYFSRFFKKTAGLSPRNFRHQP
jgi:AraC family transcriptional regulator, transcriptional activator of pobA